MQLQPLCERSTRTIFERKHTESRKERSMNSWRIRSALTLVAGKPKCERWRIRRPTQARVLHHKFLSVFEKLITFLLHKHDILLISSNSINYTSYLPFVNL
jgi:hypothetical protein